MFSQQMFRFHANGETFRETCFLNNVSATMFPRLRGPQVGPRLGFGRWNFKNFIGVTNGHVFLTFPYPVLLAQGSMVVPKYCPILLAVTSNHVQVRLGCT